GVDRLDAFASPVLEANRLRQRSRANAALGQHLAAVADAERAQRLAPDDPSLTELLGDQLAAAGDAGRAIETLRAALAQLARGGGNPLARARIYRKIGQAEESRGQPANAYDAYRIAVELAREPIAASRLARMREDAGMP
ncbi:MAG TPA: hypothetical protein VD788_11130, partial [Candidatus Polarisedimenticolaceae bacterium]|nr:hypothetical protein [Candidatus Polarisedimenticolaceae bacterium]